MQTQRTPLHDIEQALVKLDQRRHVVPARLEVSYVQEPLQRGWVAQIMADPLARPLTGFGADVEGALTILAENIGSYDWRRVKR